MPESKLKMGLIGLGRIGWKHCEKLFSHPDFQLTAVVDTEKSRCKEAEEEFNCSSFGDYLEMFEQTNLNAVVIASPTHLHKEMALNAFAEKIHVFLEKPMAMNASEAEEIVEAAKKSDCKLTVYQPHRVQAYFQQIKKIIESGVIGKPYHFRRGIFNWVRRNDWQSLTKFGGGMLNNYGAHAIDQLLELTGYKVKNLFCDLRIVASLGDAEDVVKIVYDTDDNKIGEIDINQASLVKPYNFEIYGTNGFLSVDKETINIKRFDPETLPEKQLNENLASADRKYPSDQIDIIEESITVDQNLGIDHFANFADAIRNDIEPYIKPEESLAVMRLMDRCRKFAEEDN